MKKMNNGQLQGATEISTEGRYFYSSKYRHNAVALKENK
jgi:hypothetical protein